MPECFYRASSLIINKSCRWGLLDSRLRGNDNPQRSPLHVRRSDGRIVVGADPRVGPAWATARVAPTCASIRWQNCCRGRSACRPWANTETCRSRGQTRATARVAATVRPDCLFSQRMAGWLRLSRGLQAADMGPLADYQLCSAGSSLH